MKDLLDMITKIYYALKREIKSSGDAQSRMQKMKIRTVFVYSDCLLFVAVCLLKGRLQLSRYKVCISSVVMMSQLSY